MGEFSATWTEKELNAWLQTLFEEPEVFEERFEMYFDASRLISLFRDEGKGEKMMTNQNFPEKVKEKIRKAVFPYLSTPAPESRRPAPTDSPKVRSFSSTLSGLFWFAYVSNRWCT